MLRRIQGWLKSAGGLSVAAACLATSAAYAEDENPKVIKPKLGVSGNVTVQILEEGKDGKVIFQVGENAEEKQAGDKKSGLAERKPERKEGEKKEREPQEKRQPQEMRRNVLVRVAEQQEPSYWIGIRCEPVNEALRAQLNLGAGRGLIIEEVVPNSPAAKAGLKQHDVLVQSGDTLLDDVPALMDAVAKTKDGELKLKLVRGGDTLTIAVKPAKRTEEGALGGGTVIVGESNDEALKNLMKQLEEVLEKARKGEGRGENVPKMQFFHPGVVLPPGAPLPGAQLKPGMPLNVPPRGWVVNAQAAPLPENMTVTISKSGANPAKITVKQGEKSWETTDDKLFASDALPAEVREHVLRMLGRAPFPNAFGGGFGPPNTFGGGLRPGAALNPNPNPAPRTGEPKPGAPLNPGPAQIGEPNVKPQNPKPQTGANPGNPRVIELEITPGGELKRSERKPEENKPNPEKEAASRLEALRTQLQEQAKRLQTKVTGNVEERVERSLHALHEKFENIEQRLKNLEHQMVLSISREKPAAANPSNPATTRHQVIIKELDNAIKKQEEKKSERKSDKDDDDDKGDKKDND
jgi:hypothetical protein